MDFKLFVEALDKEDIDWWSRYAGKLNFKTPEEAREWIFQRKQHSDSQPNAKFFGISGPEYNRSFANSMPIYKSGKSFKIGKRIRNKPFGWDDVEIRPNSLESLETAGYVNMFDGPELGPVQMVSVNKLYKTEDHADKNPIKVRVLANQIKSGEGYFKAIVYDDNGAIIDGHHRYEAAKLLRMTKVPAQQIRYD